MPTGRYRVIGDDGATVGTEAFRCAPGPMGWRYVSQVDTNEYGPHQATVDIAVDSAWRIVRAHVRTEQGHELHLERGEGAMVGHRDGEPMELPYGPEDHLDYFTAATNLITCRRLQASAEIEVVFVDPFSLEPTRERQRYDLLGDGEVDTAVGRFQATRWRYTSLASGWTSELWVAGDVVVQYDRIFELTEYEPGATGPHAS
jgi:hypothetical protein